MYPMRNILQTIAIIIVGKVRICLAVALQFQEYMLYFP